MNKIHIVHSEYVQHGMVLESRTRYILDKGKALQIYKETLEQMKEENKDMVDDKENYSTNKCGQRTNKFFECFYKYQPGVSNFKVEISTEELE